MPKYLPQIGLLRKMIRYEPETGKLFWLERTPDMFSATAGRSAEHSCSNWNSRYAGLEAFTSGNGDGYKQGRIFGHAFFAHRVGYALHFGEWPSDEIDHIDNNRSNNAISNLRIANRSQNSCNSTKPKDNKSGVKGVSWSKKEKKWAAQIWIRKRRVACKYFSDLKDAEMFMQNCRAKHHKEFAKS